jgi:hypothetical protein
VVVVEEDGQTQTQVIQVDQAAAEAGQDHTGLVQVHNQLNQEIQVLMDLEIQEALHQDLQGLAEEAEEQEEQELAEHLISLEDQEVLAVLILFQDHR